MSVYQVQWFKCKAVGWCDLFRINLDHSTLKEIEAVYICWTGSVADESRKYLTVGQGLIKETIRELRQETGIKAFQHQGVFITWAEVPHYRLNSIEVFCYNELKPLLPSEDLPKASSKKVNLPFDKPDKSFKGGKFA